jgi:hypothetical protein
MDGGASINCPDAAMALRRVREAANLGEKAGIFMGGWVRAVYYGIWYLASIFLE